MYSLTAYCVGVKHLNIQIWKLENVLNLKNSPLFHALIQLEQKTIKLAFHEI